jgi:hypothetical protein
MPRVLLTAQEKKDNAKRSAERYRMRVKFNPNQPPVKHRVKVIPFTAKVVKPVRIKVVKPKVVKPKVVKTVKIKIVKPKVVKPKVVKTVKIKIVKPKVVKPKVVKLVKIKVVKPKVVKPKVVKTIRIKVVKPKVVKPKVVKLVKIKVVKPKVVKPKVVKPAKIKVVKIGLGMINKPFNPKFKIMQVIEVPNQIIKENDIQLKEIPTVSFGSNTAIPTKPVKDRSTKTPKEIKPPKPPKPTKPVKDRSTKTPKEVKPPKPPKPPKRETRMGETKTRKKRRILTMDTINLKDAEDFDYSNLL